MDIDELMTQWRHRHALMVRPLCRLYADTPGILLSYYYEYILCTAWSPKAPLGR